MVERERKDGRDNGRPKDPPDTRQTVRIAAVGDLHCTKTSQGVYQALFNQVSSAADILVLCGDLTDFGTAEEAQVLARELSTVRLPVLAVLGNHDYESGHPDEVKRVLADVGVKFLDGDAQVVRGVGFAGIKGFFGGFGRGTLSAFGEAAVKRFVQEAIDESLKLESALQRLANVRQRIAVMHYSPVRDTVEGEPPEIFPFLGCGRFEEPLNRYQVKACVHGHAHKGTPEGKTAAGVPVYNVSYSLMRRTYPDRPAFRLLEVAIAEQEQREKADEAATPVTAAPVHSEVK